MPGRTHTNCGDQDGPRPPPLLVITSHTLHTLRSLSIARLAASSRARRAVSRRASRSVARPAAQPSSPAATGSASAPPTRRKCCWYVSAPGAACCTCRTAAQAGLEAGPQVLLNTRRSLLLGLCAARRLTSQPLTPTHIFHAAPAPPHLVNDRHGNCEGQHQQRRRPPADACPSGSACSHERLRNVRTRGGGLRSREAALPKHALLRNCCTTIRRTLSRTTSFSMRSKDFS